MTLAAAQLAQLAPPLASALEALNADPAVGGGLSITSGWRSEASQISLRQQHCGGTQYDIYQKPSSQCSPPTAIPGTSNHEVTAGGKPWALAADLAGPLTAAHSVMARYSLHTPVSGEPWHFELTNTTALRALAQSGATPASDGTLSVPGVGTVDPAPTSSTPSNILTAAAGKPSWGLRLATFVAGLVFSVLGAWILFRTGGKPQSKRGEPPQHLKSDMTDDGGDDDQADDDQADDAEPSDIAAGPGDEGAVSDAGLENAGSIVAAA